MRNIRKALKKRSDYNKNNYYVFLVNKSEKGEKNGLMPFNSRFGFIFTGDNSQTPTANSQKLFRTIAHELGHGAFKLKHNFDDKKTEKRSTQNLLDYLPTANSQQPTANFTVLRKYQWDEIISPRAIAFGWSEELYSEMEATDFYMKIDNLEQKYKSGDEITLIGKPNINLRLFKEKKDKEKKAKSWFLNYKLLSESSSISDTIKFSNYTQENKLVLNVTNKLKLNFDIKYVEPEIVFNYVDDSNVHENNVTIVAQKPGLKDGETKVYYGEAAFDANLRLKNGENILNNSDYLLSWEFIGETKEGHLDKSSKIELPEDNKEYKLILHFFNYDMNLTVKTLKSPILELEKSGKYNGYGYDDYNYKSFDLSGGRYKSNYVEKINSVDYNVPYITLKCYTNFVTNLEYKIAITTTDYLKYRLSASHLVDLDPEIIFLKGDTTVSFFLNSSNNRTSKFEIVEIKDGRGNLKGKFKIMIENNLSFKTRSYKLVAENDFGTVATIPVNLESGLNNHYEQAYTKWNKSGTNQSINLSTISNYFLATGYTKASQTALLKKNTYNDVEHKVYGSLVLNEYLRKYGVPSENVIIFSNKSCTTASGFTGEMGSNSEKISIIYKGADAITITHEVGHGLGFHHIWAVPVLNNDLAKRKTDNFMSYNSHINRYFFWIWQWKIINSNIQ